MEIGNDADLEEESKMSFLEQLVKKQREKNWLGKRDMVMGGPINNIEVIDECDGLNDSVINTPVSDHFEYRKYEDKNNEKRPGFK